MTDPTTQPGLSEYVRRFAPVHFGLGGLRAACGSWVATRFSEDQDDPLINCEQCRAWLKGYRAGLAEREAENKRLRGLATLPPCPYDPPCQDCAHWAAGPPRVHFEYRKAKP